MPTDWLNMPELQRVYNFPKLKTRIWAAVAAIFALSLAIILWDLFQKFFVKILLSCFEAPFKSIPAVLSYLPPFEQTPGMSGTRESLVKKGYDSMLTSSGEYADQTILQLYSEPFVFFVNASFYLFMAVSIHVWIYKRFTLALMPTEADHDPPFVFWRAMLSLVLNIVAVFTFFMFVHKRVSSRPSGDSSGGIEAFLYMLSETLELVFGWLQTLLLHTSRLELRLMWSYAKTMVKDSVEDTWTALRCEELWPLRLAGSKLKALLWCSVGVSALDVLLLFGGDGRRVTDLLLRTRMVRGRMEGAGNNDSWQFATTWDLNCRLGLVVSLLRHEWRVSALVLFGCLFHGHVLWLGSLGARRLAFLWEDPRKVQSQDRGQRQVREHQQQVLAADAERRAAELEAKRAAGQPAGKMNLGERAAKYAPNVYKELAGHDWDAAGEQNRLGEEAGAGAGLRQRKGKGREMDGAVVVLRGMREWGEVREETKAADRLLAVLYVKEGSGEAGAAVEERLRGVAEEMDNVQFAKMKVDGWLEELSTHVGRFSGRFPVLHVYDKGLKVEQVTGNDMSELEELLAKAAKARRSGGGGAAGGGAAKRDEGPSWAAVGGAEAAGAGRKGRDAALPAEGCVGEVGTGREWEAVLAGAGERLVVVDFTATWCGPCQRIKSDYHRLAETYGEVVFLQVDVDQNDEVAGRCRVASMPTFQFYQRGAKVHQVTGANIPAVEQAILRLA